MNENLTLLAIVLGIIHSGIRLATPYLYAAIGETSSFWAELNELKVTVAPSFCALTGHFEGIPHLGTANFFSKRT